MWGWVGKGEELTAAGRRLVRQIGMVGELNLRDWDTSEREVEEDREEEEVLLPLRL